MTSYRFHRWYKIIFVSAVFLIVVYPLFAQDTGTRIDGLGRRIKYLEDRFDTTESRLNMAFGVPRSFSRRGIESGEIMGGVVIASGNTKLQLGGYIQADVIYNFQDPGPLKDAMVPGTIPSFNSGDGEFFMGIRATRVFTKTETETPVGIMKTHFEFDLFNPDQTTTFSLRHAWAVLGRLGVGHYWSNFMDIDVFPNIFEDAGPNSMPYVRQPQVRYTIQVLPEKIFLSFSAEKPSGQLQSDTSLITKRITYPDGIVNLRFQWGKEDRNGISHIQLSSLLHPVSFKINRGKFTKLGYGFNFSALIQLYHRNNLTFETTCGKGIDVYSNDLALFKLDAVLNPSGRLFLLETFGGFLFYNFWWTDRFSTSVGVSYLYADTHSSQPLIDYQNGQYAIANFVYYPVNSFKVGLEYQYGRSRKAGGALGVNNRLQFSVQFRF